MHPWALSQMEDTEIACDMNGHQVEAWNEALGEHKWRVVNSAQWVEEGVRTFELSLERKVEVQYRV